MAATSTRSRILKSARAHFARGGVEHVSLRRIAADVGVTPMAIYRHFADKEAIVEALVLEGLDEWARRVEGVRGDEPLEWLRAVADEFLRFALDEPRRFEAAFLVPSRVARRYPDDFVAGTSPAGRLWTARFEELQRQGRLRPGVEPVEAGFTLWALGQGLITLYWANRFSGGEDEFRVVYQRALQRALDSFVIAVGR